MITGDRIRAYRTRQGMTQAQLAEFIGVNITTVAKWERGEMVITRPMQLLFEHLIANEKHEPRRPRSRKQK